MSESVGRHRVRQAIKVYSLSPSSSLLAVDIESQGGLSRSRQLRQLRPVSISIIIIINPKKKVVAFVVF